MNKKKEFEPINRRLSLGFSNEKFCVRYIYVVERGIILRIQAPAVRSNF